MNFKTKNLFVGAITVATAITPATTLAYNTVEENTSTNSSKTDNLNSRGVESRISGNSIANEDINLRKTDSWKGEIIEVIKKGEPVFVMSSSGEFSKVKHDGKTGYVPTKHLKEATNIKKVTDNVNLRKSASWSGDIIHVVNKGEEISLISNDGEFSKVQHEGSIGYIPTKYIEGASSTTTNNKKVTDSVNLRTSASWSADIIHVVKKGETVNVISNNGEFSKVEHNGKTGYIPTKYIEGMSGGSSTTTNNKKVTESVNLRKTASWSGEVIHVVKKGETVNVLSNNGEFSKVEHNGKTGYIPTKYIEGMGGSSSSTPTTNNKKVTESVNLRKTASWSGEVIHVVKKGETVNVLSNSGEFSKVEHNGKTGYIPTKYIEGMGGSSNSGSTSNPNIESMNKTGKVVNLKSGDTLNVRSQADPESKILGTLSNGASVKITGKDKKTGWYRIDFNGQDGYVNDYYIQISSSSSESSSTYKKTTENLNLRTGPSTNESIILTIPKGTVVKVISSSNGWDYVEYNGKKGYCSNEYLVSTNETPVVKYITTENLVFRKGPGTNHDKILTIPKGTVIDVISISGDWAKIKYDGKEGYVHTDYIEKYDGNTSSGGGSSTLPPSKPSYSRVKIVVDAGHGGHDSGATSFGRYEKDLALAISKKVNANLKTLGFQTIMTRSTDVYIPLSERYTIANNNKADMFVSIHLNSGPSSAYGIETLYKNSKSYASSIQQEVIRGTGARDRGLKYRDDLAVLNGTRMPAALVETGFITNSSESANLASGSYQDKLASSIARGIAKYTDSNISK